MPVEKSTVGGGGRRGPSLGPLPGRVREMLERAAESSLPVLLEGETGTGKTYLAEWIHRLGPRRARAFVPVNCATLPPTLIEAELFGTVRGAYTDARESRAGLVEAANGGTLFLDEIAEIPVAEQSKLLTLVEEGWIRRVGSTPRISVDVRIVCATSRDLGGLIASHAFREDLYFRCCGMRIRIPPLRERGEQVGTVVLHLLGEIRERQGLPAGAPEERVTAAAMEFLRAHPWPGNVRQLTHALTVAVLNAGPRPVTPRDVPEELLVLPGAPGPGEGRRGGSRKERYLAPADPHEERRGIVAALRQTGGNRTRAARLLGMSRQVLWERLRSHRIAQAEWELPRSEAAPAEVSFLPVGG
jgi:DNA-binding NtrC family response regulator